MTSPPKKKPKTKEDALELLSQYCDICGDGESTNRCHHFGAADNAESHVFDKSNVDEQSLYEEDTDCSIPLHPDLSNVDELVLNDEESMCSSDSSNVDELVLNDEESVCSSDNSSVDQLVLNEEDTVCSLLQADLPHLQPPRGTSVLNENFESTLGKPSCELHLSNTSTFLVSVNTLDTSTCEDMSSIHFSHSHVNDVRRTEEIEASESELSQDEQYLSSEVQEENQVSVKSYSSNSCVIMVSSKAENSAVLIRSAECEALNASNGEKSNLRLDEQSNSEDSDCDCASEISSLSSEVHTSSEALSETSITVHFSGSESDISDCSFRANEQIQSDTDEECSSIFGADENSHLLHSSTDVTRKEAIYQILKVYLSTKCSKDCLKKILSTVCHLLPNDHTLPRSMHHLLQYLKDLAPPTKEIKHFYCTDCFVSFGTSLEVPCGVCNSGKEASFFFELDIEHVVKYYFEYRDLARLMDTNSQATRDHGVCDVTDGSVYKDLNQNRGKYDLTLILYTDGVKLKKSSTSDMWFLMIVPAEVPLNLRASFISVIGVWCHEHAPNMNTFLKPFCVKLKNIFEKGGVTWTHPTSGQKCTSQVIAPLVIADAPARAKVQNISNFNGRYGCNVCEVKTVRSAPIPGKKQVRVFPQTFTARLREGQRMLSQGKRALQLNQKIKGVKGPSIMSILIYVDLALLLLPEFMHSVLLGVVKQLMNIWFHKNGPWSLKNFAKNISDFLEKVKPPDFIQRKPRSISALKFWKASEFLYWLLYYSLPALKSYLPKIYLEHYMLLVTAVHTLLKTNIKEHEITEAENMLQLFVHDMKELYTDREMTYNVHQLGHLGLMVRRWGPLHCNSAFQFEDMNGIISKTTHGKNHIAQEIVNNIKLSQGIHILKREVEQQKLTVGTSPTLKVLGNKFLLDLTEGEKAALLAMGITEAHYGYKRAKIGNNLFTSTNYKTLKSCDYNVSWAQNNYGSIRFFIKSRDQFFVFIDKFDINHVGVLFHTETRKTVKHILPIERSPDYVIHEINANFQIRKEIRVGDFLCIQPNLVHQVL